MDSAAGPLPTARERQIVRLLCEGCSNQEIAERLGLQYQPSRSQLTAIFTKVKVSTRVQLAVYAVRHGWDR